MNPYFAHMAQHKIVKKKGEREGVGGGGGEGEGE